MMHTWKSQSGSNCILSLSNGGETELIVDEPVLLWGRLLSALIVRNKYFRIRSMRGLTYLTSISYCHVKLDVRETLTPFCFSSTDTPIMALLHSRGITYEFDPELNTYSNAFALLGDQGPRRKTALAAR
jgi:hypothetical protein